MLLRRVAWFDGRRFGGTCGTGDAVHFGSGYSRLADCVRGIIAGGSLVVEEVRGPNVLGGSGWYV